MTIRRTAWLLTALVMASCSSPNTLDVRPMHLRNREIADEEEAMIRGEQRRLFHGAIGVREQEQCLGHYYTVLWRNDEVGEPVEVRFEYQQGESGSRVLTKTQTFDGSMKKGRAEFRVIGDDYLKKGRVLAWRCSLWRGGREIEHRQSYLWE